MSRRFVFIAVALLLGGCRSRPAQLDPFLGKTTVPPPATGSVGAQGAGVLAYPAAPPTFNTPAVTTPGITSPGIGTPAPGTPLAPSGSFTPNNSPPAVTVPPRILSSNTPGGTPSTPSQFVGTSSTPIRVVPPDPNNRVPVGASRPNSAGGIDIMDLPPHGQGAQPKTATGAPRGALQSYVPPPGTGANTGATAAAGVPPNMLPAKTVTLPAAQNGYGYDDGYTKLTGRLEYSALDGRWLLRYVAPENKTDRFGGVAVLAPSGSMAGFRNGDFVTAQGRLEAAGSASPTFTATAISAQRDVR